MHAVVLSISTEEQQAKRADVEPGGSTKRHATAAFFAGPGLRRYRKQLAVRHVCRVAKGAAPCMLGRGRGREIRPCKCSEVGGLAPREEAGRREGGGSLRERM